MLQDFEDLHKSASVSFNLIKPVKPKPLVYEATDIPKTLPEEQSSWFNYKTAGALLAVSSTIGFFALKTLSDVAFSQNNLGNAIK